MVKGAIFDMDGTLLDSMPVWRDAGDRFLLQRGIAPPPGLYQALKSFDMPQTAQYLLEHFPLQGSLQETIDSINSLVMEQYQSAVPLKEGVLPLLLYLQERGVRLCAATASDRVLAEAAFSRTGILPYFERILTCTEEGISKTRPEFYRQAAAKLGLLPQETAVFEDALHAVKAARAAGFFVVAVAEPSAREDEREIRKTADLFVKRIDGCKAALEAVG